MEAILREVEKIFRDILENENIVLYKETTANDIDGWDSLTHIQLIVAIEKHFKIKFTSSEIQSWKNVGAMCEAIQRRLSGHEKG